MMCDVAQKEIDDRRKDKDFMEKINDEKMQEDVRINGYMPLMGLPGTPLGKVFCDYIEELGAHNIHYICSLVYNLGKIHGKREERARRKRYEQ